MENFTDLKYYICCLFIVLLAGSSVDAQNIDSLETELQRTSDDSTRLRLMTALTSQFELADFSKSQRYAEQSVALAEQINESWALILAYRNMAITNVLLGDYSTALRYSTQALQKSIEADSTLR